MVLIVYSHHYQFQWKNNHLTSKILISIDQWHPEPIYPLACHVLFDILIQEVPMQVKSTHKLTMDSKKIMIQIKKNILFIMYPNTNRKFNNAKISKFIKHDLIKHFLTVTK